MMTTFENISSLKEADQLVRLEIYSNIVKKFSENPENDNIKLKKSDANILFGEILTDVKQGDSKVYEIAVNVLLSCIKNKNLAKLLPDEQKDELLKSIIGQIQITQHEVLKASFTFLADMSSVIKFNEEMLKDLLENVAEIIEKKSIPVSSYLCTCMYIQKFVTQYEDKIPSFMPILSKLIFLPLSHSSGEVRKVAMKTLEIFPKPVLESHNEVITSSLLKFVRETYSKELLSLFQKKQELYVLKIWGQLVNAFGKSLHTNLKKITPFFHVIEQGFKASSEDVIIASFSAWKNLINSFTLEDGVLNDSKKLRFVLKPFQNISRFSEKVLLNVCDTWWYLAWSLSKDLSVRFTEVCIPLLELTVGKISSALPERSVLKGVHNSLIKRGLCILLRLLEQPENSAFNKLSSPKKVASIPYYSLQVPLDLKVILRHFREIIYVARTVVEFFGNEKDLTNHIESLMKSLLCIVASASEDGNKESLNQFLCMISDFVVTRKCHAFVCLKSIESCSKLPRKILVSHCFNNGTLKSQDILSITLLKLLLNPYLLSSEKSKRLSTFNRLVQASISESLSPLLVTQKIIHVTKASLINCSDAEMLLEIWSYIASSLLDTTEKTQEVNQGDKRDHDFSCMYDILLWPFESSFLVPAAQVPTSSAFKLWKNLFKAFIRCSSLVDTALPNEACEIFCVRLKNMLKPDLLQEAEFYESVCSYMQEVIECVDYASSGILNAHGLSDTLLMAKQKKPLGNLTSLVDVLVLLLEIFYSQYVLPDEEQKQVPLLRRGPTSKLKGPLGLVKDFINNIKSASVIRFTIEKLAEPLSVFFSIVDNKKTFVDKQLELLWDVLTSTIERHYLGPYDSDFLATLSPILELSLCHSKRHIKEKSRKFWFATFGPVTSLQYPESLKISLNKAKLRLLPDQGLDSVNEFSVTNFSSSTQESDPIPNTPSAKIHFVKPASVNDVKSPAKNSTTGMQSMKPTFVGSVSSGAKNSSTADTQKPTLRKANIEDLPDEIFVKIDPPAPCRQSARQRNSRKRKSYIPALYSELSQDMSQDTNTISSSAESHDACSSVEFRGSDPRLEYAKCTSEEKTVVNEDNGEYNPEPNIKKRIIEISSNEREVNTISNDVIIINDTPNEGQEIKYSANDLKNHVGRSEKNSVALSNFESKSSLEKRKRKIEPDEVPACSSAKYRLSSRSCSENFNQADIEVIGISDSEEIIPSSQNSSENESYMKLSVGDTVHKILLNVEKSSEKTSELFKDPAAPEETINTTDQFLNSKQSDENKLKTEYFEVINDHNEKESVSSLSGLALINENELPSSVEKSLETSTTKMESHVKKGISELNSSVEKVVSEKNVNDEPIFYNTRSMSKGQKSNSNIKNSRRLSKSNNTKLGKQCTDTSAGACTNLKFQKKSSSRKEDTASNPSVHCKLDIPVENNVKQFSSEKLKVNEFANKHNEPTSLEEVITNIVQTNEKDVCGEETNENILKNTEIKGTDDFSSLSGKLEEINDNQDETGNLILNSKCIQPNLMLTTENAAVNHFLPKDEHSHGTGEKDENIVKILNTKTEEHIPSLIAKKRCERKKAKSKKKTLSENKTFDGKLVNNVADNASLTMEKSKTDDVSILDNINELIEIHQSEAKQNEIVEIGPECNDSSNIVLSVEEHEIGETPMLDNEIEDTCREVVSSFPMISSEQLRGKEVSVSKDVEFDETPMLESEAEEAENPNNDGQDMVKQGTSFMKFTEIASVGNMTSSAVEKCEKEESPMLDNNSEEHVNLQSITKNKISDCESEDGPHGMTSCIKSAENIKILTIDGSIEKGTLNTKVAREHKTLAAESERHDKASSLPSFIKKNESSGIENNNYSFQVSEVAVENKENICDKNSEDPTEPNSIVSVDSHSFAILCNKNDENIPYLANPVKQPNVESVCQLEYNTASNNPLIVEAAPMHNVHEFSVSSLKKDTAQDDIQSSKVTKASVIQSERGDLSDATNSDLEETSELCISNPVPKKKDDNAEFFSTPPDLATKGNSGDNSSNLEYDSVDIDKGTPKGCVVEKLPEKSVHTDDKNQLDIMPSNNEHPFEEFIEIFTTQTETCNGKNSIGSLLKSTEFERNFNEINEGIQDFSADKECEEIISVSNVEDFQIKNIEGDRKDSESHKEKTKIDTAETSNMKPVELLTDLESGQFYLEKENSKEFNNFLGVSVGNMFSQEKIDSAINEAVSNASEVILPEIKMLLNDVLREVDGLTHNSVDEMSRLFSENNSSIPTEGQINHLQQFQVNKRQVQIVVTGLCNEVTKEVEGSKKRKKKVPVRATVAHKVKAFVPLVTKKNLNLKVNEFKTLKNMQPSEITNILKEAYGLTQGNQTESKNKKTILSNKGLSPLTKFVTTSDSHEKEVLLTSNDMSPKTKGLSLLHLKNKMGSDQMKTLNTYFNTNLSPQTRSFKMITASRKKLFKASEENNLHTNNAAITTSESPVNVVPSKKKRVTFADPLVEEKFLDDVSVENYAKKSRKLPARGRPKKLQSCFAAPKNEVNRRVSLTTSFPVDKEDNIPSSSEFQDSDSLTEFSNLPVCSVLINCEDSVSNILHYLTSPTWVRGLESLLLSKNIKTIGDLCRLNVHEVKALPFKSPKVISLHKALIAYLTQVQTMTMQKFQRFEDGCPEQEEKDCLSNSTNDRLDDNEIPSGQQVKGKISNNEEEILNEMVETLLQNGKIEKLPSHLLSALSRKCVGVLTEKIEKSCI